MKKITIIARDEDNKIEKMMEDIKGRGNCGHTFSITIENKGFVWDGDGSDNIKSVQVEDFFTVGELKDHIRAVTRYENGSVSVSMDNKPGVMQETKSTN